MSAQNGRLPAAHLATIPGTTQLIAVDLLTQVVALRAAFHREFAKPLAITDAYRSLVRQESMFRARFTTDHATSAKIDPRTWQGRTWWRRPGATSSATPGTSVHGWGRAIDFGSGVNRAGSAEHTWMVANAPADGFVWPILYRSAPYFEPWHFEGTPMKAKNLPREEDDMPWTDTTGTTNPATGEPNSKANALQVSQHYAFRGWELGIANRDQLNAQRAQITGLIGAVNAMAQGEELDQAKLLAGIEAAAAKGAAEGTRAEVTRVEDIIREVAGVNADAVLDALRDRLGAS